MIHLKILQMIMIFLSALVILDTTFSIGAPVSFFITIRFIDSCSGSGSGSGTDSVAPPNCFFFLINE